MKVKNICKKENVFTRKMPNWFLAVQQLFFHSIDCVSTVDFFFGTGIFRICEFAEFLSDSIEFLVI